MCASNSSVMGGDGTTAEEDPRDFLAVSLTEKDKSQNQ